MQIVLDTNNVGDKDVELLAAFVAVLRGGAPTVTAVAKTTRTRKKTEPAPEPEEPPSEAATQDVESASEGPTQKEAVAYVTKKVADGKARRIKLALTKMGASRLSELADDSLGEFMAEATRLCALSEDEFKKIADAS
jgi:hypothetical protein